MADYHDALIYTMRLVAAADGEVAEVEINRMAQILERLPVFEGYLVEDLHHAANQYAAILAADDDGLDTILTLIGEMLPSHLRETAYALACDVAAADSKVSVEESELLMALRQAIGVDRLAAAAIERGARARYMRA
jgi:tellurite resistance protein